MKSKLTRTAVFSMLCIAGSAHADVKIGLNVPLTGFAAADGKSALEGAKLAVAQANAMGGINGEKIELVIYDDQASPKEAAPIAIKLVEKDKVVVAVSGSYSASTRAAAPIFQNAKTPYVVAYSIHPDVTTTGDYIFRTTTMGEVQGRAGAKFIGETLKKKNVALITLKNDFGQALASGFKEGAPKFGIKLTGEYEYGMSDRQFGPMIASLKADNPEAIYASGYFFTAGPLVSQLRAAGITVPVIGQEGYDSEKFIEIAGAAAEGVYVTTSLDRDSASSITKAYLMEFKKTVGSGSDMVAAATYSATFVAIEAMKKVGTGNREKIRNAIASGTFDTPIGKLSFNDLHEVNKDVQVQIVKDKAFRHFSVISDPVYLAAPTKSSVK
jgi:branched-chain amino acid transport system substrate-binding protein